MNSSGTTLQWAIIVTTLAVIACINGLDLVLKVYSLRLVKNNEHYDANHPLRLKFAAMTFENPDDVYGIESDEDWATVLPRGDGFLYPREISPNITLYGVSMFHQLQCVDMLRRIYNLAKRGELAAHAKDEMHMLHCMGYLRQGILCAADTTLEKLYTLKNNTSHSEIPSMSTSGMDFTHKCRDASPLKKVLEESFHNALKIMNEHHPEFHTSIKDARGTK